MLLQDGFQVKLLLVVKVEIFALGLRLGPYCCGNGSPVSSVFSEPCVDKADHW